MDPVDNPLDSRTEMPGADLTDAVCPRCGGAFGCGAAGPGPCPCSTITLSLRQQAVLRARYQGCLCLRCLAALADERAGEWADERADERAADHDDARPGGGLPA